MGIQQCTLGNGIWVVKDFILKIKDLQLIKEVLKKGVQWEDIILLIKTQNFLMVLRENTCLLYTSDAADEE